MTLGWSDLASLAAILSVLGAGVWKLITATLSASDGREDRLEKRERSHDEAIDKQIRSQNERIASLERTLQTTQRNYTALVATLTILVDQFVASDPLNPALSGLAANLKMSFPVEDELPLDLVVLLRRLDARLEEGGDAT